MAHGHTPLSPAVVGYLEIAARYWREWERAVALADRRRAWRYAELAVRYEGCAEDLEEAESQPRRGPRR